MFSGMSSIWMAPLSTLATRTPNTSTSSIADRLLLAAQSIGGDAALLCRAFPCTSPANVESILRRPSGEDRYRLEFRRHADLARALGMPTFVAGFGYNDVKAGELPDDLEEDDINWVE